MMISKTWWCSLFLMVVSLSAKAQFSYELISTPGRQIAVSENHHFPKVVMSVLLPAGSAQDTLPGTAALTAKLLTSSTALQNETDFADALDSVGAQLSYDVSKDWVMFQVVFQSNEAATSQAFQSMYEMIYHPNWDEDIFERERQRAKDALSEQLTRPAMKARQFLYSLLFEQHPYAQLSSGQPSALALQSLDRLKQFYQHHYRTDNMIILVSGDMSVEQVKSELAKHWPNDKHQQHAVRKIPPVYPNVKSRSYQSPSDYHQAHMLKGTLLPGERVMTDEEAAYLTVANKILGGGMASRLFEKVRGEQGLVYNVYSRVSFMQEAGIWEIGLQTKANQSGQAEQAVNDVVSAFFDQGVTAQEVRVAKESLLKKWPWHFETMLDRQHWMAEELFYKKTYQSWERYRKALEAVEVSKLNAYIHQQASQKWQTVWIGGEHDK